MPYSGCGDGKNNIEAEANKGKKPTKKSVCHFGAGPLSLGFYTIEPMEAYHKHLGVEVMYLKPDFSNTMYGRDKFYIHGDSSTHPGKASKVQNKLLWAISQQTAAELVYRRVDASLPLLGMQSLGEKNTSSIRKSDISITKNYLTEEEIKLLGLLVEQYLAFAETMAQQKTPMYMIDWINKLDAILQLNGRDLLTHAGKITHDAAMEKSSQEFERYQNRQKIKQQEESLKEIEADIKKLNAG